MNNQWCCLEIHFLPNLTTDVYENLLFCQWHIFLAKELEKRQWQNGHVFITVCESIFRQNFIQIWAHGEKPD